MPTMNANLFSHLARAAVLALTLIGCGDDDAGDDPPDTETPSGMDGGATEDGGGPSMPDVELPTLEDDTAGKACDGDSDCGEGSCAAEVPGGTGLFPEAAPGGYCTAPCLDDSTCGDGGLCAGAIAAVGLQGQCMAACEETDDCREGYECSGGLTVGEIEIPPSCRPEPRTDQLEDGVAGDACEDEEDCPGGQCLQTRGGFAGAGATALPDGYCSGSCLEDEDCGEGGVCASLGVSGFAGECYAACEGDADCSRDGYRCRAITDSVRGCNAAADPLPDNRAGAACEADTDCGGADGSCASSLPSGGFGGRVPAPEGYCSLSCSEASDCGAGGQCVGGIGGFIRGTCFATCESDDDCREGYLCESRGGGGAMAADAGMDSAGAMVCAPEPPPEEVDAGPSDAGPDSDAGM